MLVNAMLEVAIVIICSAIAKVGVHRWHTTKQISLGELYSAVKNNLRQVLQVNRNLQNVTLRNKSCLATRGPGMFLAPGCSGGRGGLRRYSETAQACVGLTRSKATRSFLLESR